MPVPIPGLKVRANSQKVKFLTISGRPKTAVVRAFRGVLGRGPLATNHADKRFRSKRLTAACLACQLFHAAPPAVRRWSCSALKAVIGPPTVAPLALAVLRPSPGQAAWLVVSGARPGTPEILPKKRVFGRPKIVKNLTFWLSDPNFEPRIGTGMAENPPYLILSSGG